MVILVSALPLEGNIFRIHRVHADRGAKKSN